MSIVRGQRLRLSLTARCPLRCGFCHGDGNTHPSKHTKDSQVPLDHVISVIALAAKRGFSTVRFTGGEPGAYPSFIKLMEVLPKLQQEHPSIVKWALTTAALPFRKKEKFDALANSALTDIAISVDSIEDGELSRPSSRVGISGEEIFCNVVEPLVRRFPGFIKINVIFDGNLTRTKNVIRRARQLNLNVTVLQLNGIMGQVHDTAASFVQLRRDVIDEFGLIERHCDSLNEDYLYDRGGRQLMKFYPDHCGANRECRICGDLDVRVIPVEGVLGIVPCFEQDQGHTIPLMVNGEASLERFDEGFKLIGIGPEWSKGTQYSRTTCSV
jgi:MoaA/NifB/PqqE/SkfB family radical SAM enzyme